MLTTRGHSHAIALGRDTTDQHVIQVRKRNFLLCQANIIYILLYRADMCVYSRSVFSFSNLSKKENILSEKKNW